MPNTKKKRNTSLQSTGISPLSLHAVPQHSRITNAKMKLDKVMNTLKNNISEAYKLTDSDCYNKNDMKEKANELVRLHEATKEKLKTASYSEKNKFLPCYLINGLEKTVQNILMSLNTL